MLVKKIEKKLTFGVQELGVRTLTCTWQGREGKYRTTITITRVVQIGT
jgi:hypothetical protein